MGNKDTVYSTGTITSVSGTGVVTGNGTTWNTGNGVVPGLVITLGTANGSGVIKSVDSTTQITLVSTAGVLGTVNAGTAYNISEQPVYLLKIATTLVMRFTVLTPQKSVLQKQLHMVVLHMLDGLVLQPTLIHHGKLRVKSEVLVAGSSITADAADDARFAE